MVAFAWNRRRTTSDKSAGSTEVRPYAQRAVRLYTTAAEGDAMFRSTGVSMPGEVASDAMDDLMSIVIDRADNELKWAGDTLGRDPDAECGTRGNGYGSSRWCRLAR